QAPSGKLVAQSKEQESIEPKDLTDLADHKVKLATDYTIKKNGVNIDALGNSTRFLLASQSDKYTIRIKPVLPPKKDHAL
ncbi:hypothetical protein ABFV55_27905, partial [Pseudomonas syringae]|uniref:hypothetical protein n=1 Tax=Pseudomonas syringae TaxID=317 RepID=UPI0034D97BBD